LFEAEIVEVSKVLGVIFVELNVCQLGDGLLGDLIRFEETDIFLVGPGDGSLAKEHKELVMEVIFLIGHASSWLKLPLGYELIGFTSTREVLIRIDKRVFNQIDIHLVSQEFVDRTANPILQAQLVSIGPGGHSVYPPLHDFFKEGFRDIIE